MSDRDEAKQAVIEIVITGGGTAGHVLPAISIAKALVTLGYSPSSIHFVGSKRGMEAKLVPQAGFELSMLPGRGIARRLTMDNVGAISGNALALVKAIRLIGKFRPRVVVTVGGYAGLPASLAAWILRIPILVVNVDAVPGAANSLIGRLAVNSAVAFEKTPLPRTIVTGAPIRQEVLAFRANEDARSKARRAFQAGDGDFLLAITTGSLGARRINSVIPKVVTLLQSRTNLLIYHVTGERDFEPVTTLATNLGLATDGECGSGQARYRVVRYENQLPDLLAACDLVLARAGASTIAEVCVIGVPSILVPLPSAPRDHQRRNAEALVATGATILLEDNAVEANSLAGLIADLLDDESRRNQLRSAASLLGRPDAARDVAKLIDNIARHQARHDTPGQLFGKVEQAS